MRIKVTDTVKNYDGKPLVENRPTEDKKGMEEIILTFREVFSTALNNVSSTEKPMTAEYKSRVFVITSKLYARSEVDITTKEAATIIERVGEIYGPLIYGRTCELLGELPLDNRDEVVSELNKDLAPKK